MTKITSRNAIASKLPACHAGIDGVHNDIIVYSLGMSQHSGDVPTLNPLILTSSGPGLREVFQYWKKVKRWSCLRMFVNFELYKRLPWSFDFTKRQTKDDPPTPTERFGFRQTARLSHPILSPRTSSQMGLPSVGIWYDRSFFLCSQVNQGRCWLDSEYHI